MKSYNPFAFLDRIPLKVRFAIGILPAIASLGILAFIARYEIAHDDATCPFHEVETRVITTDVSVREEARRCIREVEEHQWSLVRSGAAPLVLGSYPLEAAQVNRGFPWRAEVEDGRTIVTVQNEGRGELIFREPEQGHE